MFVWMTSTHYREIPEEGHDMYYIVVPMAGKIWIYTIYDYSDESLHTSESQLMRVTNFNIQPIMSIKRLIDVHHLERSVLSEKLQKIILRYCFREDFRAGMT